MTTNADMAELHQADTVRLLSRALNAAKAGNLRECAALLPGIQDSVREWEVTAPLPTILQKALPRSVLDLVAIPGMLCTGCLTIPCEVRDIHHTEDMTMKIDASVVTRITISEIPSLDPIQAILEDLAPGRGKLTLTCGSRSYAGSWTAMGHRSVSQFFCDCDEDYLAKSMSHVQPLVHDIAALEAAAKKTVVKSRKDGDIEAQRARELYDRISEGINHPYSVPSLMHDIFGDEWWYAIPSKPNPDFLHLCRVIVSAQQGLRMYQSSSPARAAVSAPA